jgi:glycosyltransferase involved in cell wall biosynthesis
VLRVLAITKIFPNAAEPLSAPFNRQQFAALAKRCELHVMATIPWFPGAGFASRWSSAGKLAEVPRAETIEGIPVTHPRTLFVPRILHGAWGPMYAASILPQLHRFRGKVDVVLGSWAYPDGFAAVVAAKLLRVPAVVKLHGSDVNIIAKLPGPRRLSQWALPQAAKIVAVSRALADEVVELGVPRENVALVMNGVNSDLFHVADRVKARRDLGIPELGPLALYVGNLKPEKGVLDLAEAWKRVGVPGARLVIVGGGAAKDQLASQGLHVVGPQPLERIPRWLAAADVLVLPSHAEGTPNVVLEALACGRRVVASAVGGIPDLVNDPLLGALVPPKNPPALAAALAEALRTPYDPAAVAVLGARNDWDASAKQLLAVLEAARG